jgi:hypothetical protein
LFSLQKSKNNKPLNFSSCCDYIFILNREDRKGGQDEETFRFYDDGLDGPGHFWRLWRPDMCGANRGAGHGPKLVGPFKNKGNENA